MTVTDESPPRLTSDAATEDRIRTCVAASVDALHALVRQLGLTEAELHALIGFLTRVAQSDEMMLLSDVTQTSILVDGLTHLRSGGDATSSNVLGPMYRPGQKEADTPAAIARVDQGDDALTLRGTVVDANTGLPLPGALIDIWQTNQSGLYDDQDPEQPAGNLRGIVRCDEVGAYVVTTVIPGPYRIASMNGPVYALLNTLGRHDNRPGHIHLRITAADHEQLITMLFMAGDPWLADDVIGAVKSDLVIAPRPAEAGGYDATFNIALTPAISQTG